MAGSSSSFAALSCLLLAVALLAATASAAGENETHIRVFWHDVVTGGPNVSTIVQVAEGPSSNASATGFGTVIVIDDPLTEGPNLTSKLLGRAQGMYVSAGKDSLSLMMTMNFVFVDGDYNSSSLAILGANPAERKVREMAVVGGTGVFRFARGYCEARTQWIDNKTGDATVEYNLYVRHD
ncbi:Dirigent protein 21 [Dichanthelium oligosanthes]|uniref:Dirigent protein n=1 Tax=Dichanthelium oligosanthes TaxID=888268 RepID=A0A1E5VLK2_9POAL|nr:Dirigent protein 21 [Dichanthelium oligosanthes]